MAKFSQIIPENELWSVLDASKVQDYSCCARKFMFRHVFGWRKVGEPNIHLEFGTAVHFAMEVLAEDGYTAESYAKAYTVFLDHYRKFFPVELDEHNKPKTPANLLRMLPQYGAYYRSDDFDVLHVETAGSVPISDDRTMNFKMDTICQDDRGYFSLEHKTSARYGPMWEAGWRQKIQVGVYNHVLYCLFPEEEVFGVIINGLFLSEPPKLRKDGQPYANAKDNSFHRVPARMSPDQLQGWLVDMNDITDCIEMNHTRLADTDESDPILHAFPRNREACTQYGVCDYINTCSVCMNPLAYIHNPPMDFEIEHWDPRDIPTVKERMEL